VLSAIHDRMTVIINKEDYDLWLDRRMNNAKALPVFDLAFFSVSSPHNRFPTE